MFNCLIVLLLLCWFNVAHADIKLVVPFGAGGLTDNVARQLESGLSRELNKPIILDYRLGAAGLIGVKSLAQTKTSDVVIMFIDAMALSNIILLNDGVGLDDVNYISQVGYTTSIALAVKKNSALKNIDAWRTSKTPVNVGINGLGGAHHYYSYLFATQTRAPITDIPFKGTGEMISMLMGGHIDAIWSSASSLEQYEQAGKIEIVAVNSPRRIETFPNTPTFKEIGVDMTQGAKWVIISNNTADAATVRQIEQAVNRLLINPSFVQNLKELGITVELKLSNQSRSTMLTTLQQQAKFAEYVRSRNAK